MLMDFSLGKLEAMHEKQSPLTILMPGQTFFFVLFWYEIVLCESDENLFRDLFSKDI